ncbi:MAG: rhomboid family intramembrane serine protease [Acidimicrobiales bacterium]|nr:rhomboid family intramembrane serine protease [Acidimicrobiales bacterium]
MTDANDTTFCFHHKDRETGRSCTRCGRSACSDCLHPAAVGSHCFECIKAAQPPTRERVRRWNATAGPLVSKILIGINLVVYLITTGGSLNNGPNDTEFNLVLFGPAVADGELYRLLTSGFVHFGLIHIGFNMVLLYRFGEALESALGRTRYIALYLAALFGGSFGALLLSPDALTGGASGAVFGLLGATAVGMRQGGLRSAEGSVVPLIVINLVLSVVIPGISLGGHLGGLIGGTLVGAVMLRSTGGRPSSQQLLEGVVTALAIIAISVAGSLAVAS